MRIILQKEETAQAGYGRQELTVGFRFILVNLELKKLQAVFLINLSYSKTIQTRSILIQRSNIKLQNYQMQK